MAQLIRSMRLVSARGVTRRSLRALWTVDRVIAKQRRQVNAALVTLQGAVFGNGALFAVPQQNDSRFAAFVRSIVMLMLFIVVIVMMMLECASSLSLWRLLLLLSLFLIRRGHIRCFFYIMI